MLRKILILSIFVLSLVFVSLLWEYELALAAVLFVLGLLINYLTRLRLIKMYLLSSVLGGLAEIVAISSGAWEYSNSQWLVIPLWLPLLWGLAGLCFVYIARFFNEVNIK